MAIIGESEVVAIIGEFWVVAMTGVVLRKLVDKKTFADEVDDDREGPMSWVV